MRISAESFRGLAEAAPRVVLRAARCEGHRHGLGPRRSRCERVFGERYAEAFLGCSLHALVCAGQALRLRIFVHGIERPRARFRAVSLRKAPIFRPGLAQHYRCPRR